MHDAWYLTSEWHQNIWIYLGYIAEACFVNVKQFFNCKGVFLIIRFMILFWVTTRTGWDVIMLKQHNSYLCLQHCTPPLSEVLWFSSGLFWLMLCTLTGNFQIFNKNAVQSYLNQALNPFKIKPFQTNVHAKPFHIPCQRQSEQESDFRISWFWNQRGKRSDLGPQKNQTTSKSLQSWQWGHTDAQTVWHCSLQPNVHTELVNVYLSATCSVDPSPSIMHT